VALIPALLALCAQPSTADGFRPLPTPITTLTAPTDPAHFSFVVTGDNRSTGHGYPMPACFDEICTEIGYLHPPLVLMTGDVIEGYGDTPAEANDEYDVFLKAVSLTGVPVFNAPGNHEFSLDVANLLPIYKKRMGDLYGSFDYGNSHFVAVNSIAVHADGTVTDGSIDDAQWTWLDNDLKSTTAKNIFVYLHYYPFGPADPDTPGGATTGWKSDAERDRFHAMMVKYGVRAVFAGHNHIYYHTAKDGVDYYISGGAGAPLDASPDQGGFLHYVVVHVDGNKITTDILQPWHLAVTYPNGDGNGQSRETAWVENTNHPDVTVGAVVFHIKSPATGITASALIAGYKGKPAKPVPASIVSQTPSTDGKSVTVVVSLTAKSARTTEVTVGPK